MQCKVDTSKLILTLLAIGLLVLYKNYNPLETDFFPKCPFFSLTGFKCPGCGAQRALHFLLNADIKKAFNYNPLLVVSIPYLICAVYFQSIKTPNERQLKIRKFLLGYKASIVVLIIVCIFFIVRNLV